MKVQILFSWFLFVYINSPCFFRYVFAIVFGIRRFLVDVLYVLLLCLWCAFFFFFSFSFQSLFLSSQKARTVTLLRSMGKCIECLLLILTCIEGISDGHNNKSIFAHNFSHATSKL